MAITSKNDAGMMTGLFNDRTSAERAYQSLSNRGYTKDDINVLMSEDTRKQHFSKDGQATTELGNKAAEGAGIGGAVGGTLGAAIAAITATGTSLALPGLGLVIAGPLAAAAAGAGVGAATGGLLGALVGWGIPEERVKRYESGLKSGGILFGVRPRSAEDAAYLEQEWRSYNGQDIYRPGSGDASDYGYDHTVVGAYDDYSTAQQVIQALESDGFSRARIQLQPESDQSVSASGQSQESSGGIGSFFRSLFGMDEHKEHHDVYAESVRRGHYVVTVDAQDDDEAYRASEILSRFNPVDLDERSRLWRQQGWSGYDATAPRLSQTEIEAERRGYAQARPVETEQSTIPVIEEELKVGKRQVQRGGIRVFQRVREKPVHESVQLREEHVTIERHPVDKPATEADIAALKEGTIELRETAEEAVVSKTARVVEEVVVGKEQSQHIEEISDTVRRTDVEVEQLGASTNATRSSATTVDDTDFRRHWQTAYGTSGGRYEDYDAAYRYGSTVAGSGRYQNYQWSDVEPQLRSDWESQHPESTWEKVKDAVRYGAERVSGRSQRH